MKEHVDSARTASAARTIRHRMAWLFAAAAWTSVFCAGAAAQELTVEKTLPDLVAESEWIAIADVVGAQAHRNERGNLIVTDYRFRVTALVEGSAASEFTLTQGGGTLAGETHRISDAAELEVGQRYLVFVRPSRDGVFSPFVGGAQGAFLVSGDTAMSLGGDRTVRDRSALLDEVNALVTQRGAAPPRAPRHGTMPPGMYPSKTYRPLALTPTSNAPTSAPEADASQRTASRPNAQSDAPARPIAPVSTDSITSPDWHYSLLIAPPAVIDAFPHDWEWHPSEENQLAYWNQYGGDVFRVYATPDTNWAWGNDRFELAGWPDDTMMMAQFGTVWPSDFIGWTFSRWFGNGPIIESDTALNPAYCWTLDDAYATNGTGACESFRTTMLHEVGHGWGLNHPWETQVVSWDSVMNYSPGAYRLPRLYADDVSAVRTAFAGPGAHDALVSLYTVAASSGVGAQAAYAPSQMYTASVRHGWDLAAYMSNGFKIENLGTDDIVTPEIQFFVSQNRLNWDGPYAFLGTVYGTENVPPGWVYNYAVPSLPIPATTPTGDYYFAVYLPGADGDANNSSAWAPQQWSDVSIQVHVDNNPTSLTPETYLQVSEVGYIGPLGTWSFQLSASAGTIYTFSTCQENAGWATFDTVISVSNGSGVLASDDDTCGRQSTLIWTAPNSGTFTITVSGYDFDSQGSFQIGYRREMIDPIFAGGFDG